MPNPNLESLGKGDRRVISLRYTFIEKVSVPILSVWIELSSSAVKGLVREYEWT